VKEKGVALMMTLWVLVLLAAVALSFALSTRYGSASARNFKEDTQAYYLAISAYEEALAYLLSDRDMAVDYVDGDGNFRTDSEREPITGLRKHDGGEVILTLSDEESRLNVNVQDASTLSRLFEYVGVPGDAVPALIDSLADWKDKDDLHRLSGAEDEYYSERGYRTKNGVLDVPEELLLIKGYKPEYFYGTDGSAGLKPIITTWGRRINVNTVSPEVLEVLGLDPMEVESIMAQRRAADGLRAVPSLASPKIAAMATTKSEHIRIDVKARVHGSPLYTTITSVVERNPDGRRLKTLYWKEGIENSGT
jgi:general secretion pathway protein K